MPLCKRIGDARTFPEMMECTQGSIVEAKKYRDVPLPLVRKEPASIRMILGAAAAAAAAAARRVLEAFNPTVEAAVRELVGAVRLVGARNTVTAATEDHRRTGGPPTDGGSNLNLPL